MALPDYLLEKLRGFEVLYDTAGSDRTIIILGRSGRPYSTADMTDASRAAEDLHRAIRSRDIMTDPTAKKAREDLKERIKALFLAAGFHPVYMEEIENPYWPKSYVEEIYKSPWFQVTTPAGHFQIGWRKNVISIDWSRTTLIADGDVLFAKEQVTTSLSSVHAGGYEKAMEYLSTLYYCPWHKATT